MIMKLPTFWSDSEFPDRIATSSEFRRKVASFVSHFVHVYHCSPCCCCCLGLQFLSLSPLPWRHCRLLLRELRGQLSSMDPATRAAAAAVEKVFVALPAEKGKTTLSWALGHFRGSGAKLVVTHVHVPPQTIPVSTCPAPLIVIRCLTVRFKNVSSNDPPWLPVLSRKLVYIVKDSWTVTLLFLGERQQ